MNDQSTDLENGIRSIIVHQMDPNRHPLTCEHSNHPPLRPAVGFTGRLALVCISCGYWQDWVPDCVIKSEREKMVDLKKIFFIWIGIAAVIAFALGFGCEILFR